MKQRRQFTEEFKTSVLHELESGKPAAQICRENTIGSGLLYKWKRQYRKYPDTAFRGNGNAYTLEAKLAESQRLIGKLYAENEFLKKALQSLKSMLAENRRREGKP